MLRTGCYHPADDEDPSVCHYVCTYHQPVCGSGSIENGDPDIEEMRTAYNQRRRFLMNAFREMGLECFEPYGAFYVFPCIKEFGMTSEEFATRFLEEEKVAAVPGTAFGDSGEGYLRISYAYSLEKLKTAIGRMGHFVEKLRAEQNNK